MSSEMPTPASDEMEARFAEASENCEPAGQPDADSRALVTILPAGDVLETLAATPVDTVTTTILDPWYNKGIGGSREDYDDWLEEVIAAASRVSKHVFVWGFPGIIAHQVSRVPKGFKLMAWLTWFYKNCPSVVRGWRPAQNACLHLAAEGAEVYPEHFLNAEQLKRYEAGKMRFVPGPPTVLEAPLNIGFVGKHEQTGHPAQKPLSVFESLILMSTRENEVVLDPMCGSGTTGQACLRLNRKAILCDESEEWLEVAGNRIQAGPVQHENARPDLLAESSGEQLRA